METKLSSSKTNLLPLIEDVLISTCDNSGDKFLDEKTKKSDMRIPSIKDVKIATI